MSKKKSKKDSNKNLIYWIVAIVAVLLIAGFFLRSDYSTISDGELPSLGPGGGDGGFGGDGGCEENIDCADDGGKICSRICKDGACIETGRKVCPKSGICTVNSNTCDCGEDNEVCDFCTQECKDVDGYKFCLDTYDKVKCEDGQCVARYYELESGVSNLGKYCSPCDLCNDCEICEIVINEYEPDIIFSAECIPDINKKPCNAGCVQLDQTCAEKDKRCNDGEGCFTCIQECMEQDDGSYECEDLNKQICLGVCYNDDADCPRLEELSKILPAPK